jgi:hypothetical protein
MNYFDYYLKVAETTPAIRVQCESILKKIQSGELIYPEDKIDKFILVSERSKKPLALWQKLMLAILVTDVENSVNKEENESSPKNDLLNS